MVKKKSPKKKTSVSKHPVKVVKKTVTTTTTTTPHKIGKKTKTKPKKKVIKKRKPIIRRPVLPKSEVKLERVLIENFVGSQKVMVNLSVKFDSLTNKISKLLELFEISAKALAEKDFNLEKETKDTEKVLGKIDTLAEQNKVIARGLTLMNEKLSEEPEYPPVQKPLRQPRPQPQSQIQQPQIQQPQMQKPMPAPGKSVIPMQSTTDMAGYQRSISSKLSSPQKTQRLKRLPKQEDAETNF